MSHWAHSFPKCFGSIFIKLSSRVKCKIWCALTAWWLVHFKIPRTLFSTKLITWHIQQIISPISLWYTIFETILIWIANAIFNKYLEHFFSITRRAGAIYVASNSFHGKRFGILYSLTELVCCIPHKKALWATHWLKCCQQSLYCLKTAARWPICTNFESAHSQPCLLCFFSYGTKVLEMNSKHLIIIYCLVCHWHIFTIC